MIGVKTIFQRIKAFVRPRKLNDAELSDTAYIISMIALLLSFVSILLATR